MQTKSEGIKRPARPATGRAGAGTAKPSRPRKESYTIAYRVDATTLTWLTKGAERYGVSVHEYARQKLIETAQERETVALRAEVSEMTRGMSKLREDVAITLEILLANLTTSDPARIRAWIDENLRGT